MGVDERRTARGADHRYEAIVIGSGFGGAVAACRLAQAGVDVLLLERGRRYEAADFPALPPDSKLLPDLRRWAWQNNQGLWDILDLEELVSVQAAGYGGGSLIYANVQLRPPAAVFDGAWPEVYRGGGVLQEYFDLAAYMLEVEPVGARPGLGRQLVKADQLEKAAAHLGRGTAFFRPPLAVQFHAGANRHGIEQGACTFCGRCSTGCPERAKNTLDFNYLALAERHGAHVRTQLEVQDISALADGAWEVRGLNHLTAERAVFQGQNVFLCAGAVHSTRLLARARLNPEAYAAQELAGVGYFPGGDALGVVYDTAHPQRPSQGPTISTTLVHWHESDPGSFFLVQDGGYARELERLIGLLRAPAWLGRNRLSNVGKGGACLERSAEPSEAVAEPNTAMEGFVLASLVDELLDARTGGPKILPEELRRAFSETLKELKDPLLLPPIVAGTVDAAIRARYQKWRLTRQLKPDGFLLSRLIRWEKALVQKVYGGDGALAGHALQTLLTGSGLSPAEVLRRVLNYDARDANHRTMLLAMGRDAARGVLHYDRRQDRLVADLELERLAPGYTGEERLMTDIAGCLGGELRTNPAWAFLGKPITVHNQGGCRMSDAADDGVTTPEGAVRGAPGLYVLDGALLPGSVGVNPSATITALAERNIALFIEALRGKVWAERGATPGALEYAEQRRQARLWAADKRQQGWPFSPPEAPHVPLRSQALGVAFHEAMAGYYEPTHDLPRGDEGYRRAESRGRPDYPIELSLDNTVEDLAVFFEDPRHVMSITGKIKVRLPEDAAPVERSVRGHLQLFVQRHKPYAIDPKRSPRRLHAQERIAGRYTPSPAPPPRRKQRWMKYRLVFTDEAGQYWLFRGNKRLRDDPGFDAWRDTTSLFVRLFGPFATEPPRGKKWPERSQSGLGVVHVDATRFLFEQLQSFRVTGTDDPARKSWAVAKFALFFFGELQRVYAPELPKLLDTLFRPRVSGNRARSFWR